jgi:echinoderm microtubule-associated protein-like 6
MDMKKYIEQCRGVGALAFSPDGRLLVAVALDNVHSVIVLDWRSGNIISEGRGFAGEPPQACSPLLQSCYPASASFF